MEKRLFTSESVTEGHPDKICDNISDAVLDAIMAQDPNSRVACETAILFESGMVSYFDSILMVSAPLEIRIERCIKRNNFTREQVLERIAKQMDESKKIELSDFVIDNDNRKALYPQLKNFLNNLKA